jgi:hypothetical protein
MRPRKEPREPFASTLKKELMGQLRELSDDTGIPITKLLDEAIQLLLESRAVRDKNVRNK